MTLINGGAVKLTKNADISKYKYSGYGIGLDGKVAFSHPSDGFGNNAINFGVDASSSVLLITRKKIFYFLVKALHKDWMININCRKNAFNQLYYNENKVFFKLAL